MSLGSFALALTFGAISLWPQATQVSQISGTALDGTGAFSQGADISITNVDTGIAKTTVSGADGAYLIINLPVGQYRVQARKSGFAVNVQTGIVLDVNS